MLIPPAPFTVILEKQCSVLRYYQSTKSSGLSSNLQSTGAKADHLREEMEEAANRMEICRVSNCLYSQWMNSLFSAQQMMKFYCTCISKCFTDDWLTEWNTFLLTFHISGPHLLFQDQLSADMYSFVAKEIDYASYFQTVSTTAPLHTGAEPRDKTIVHPSLWTLWSLFVRLCVADRSPGRISQEVIRAAPECSSPDQGSSGWVLWLCPLSNPIKLCCSSPSVSVCVNWHVCVNYCFLSIMGSCM